MYKYTTGEKFGITSYLSLHSYQNWQTYKTIGTHDSKLGIVMCTVFAGFREDACGVVFTARAVRNRLGDADLCARVARKKPLLTEWHKRIRLE